MSSFVHCQSARDIGRCHCLLGVNTMPRTQDPLRTRKNSCSTDSASARKKKGKIKNERKTKGSTIKKKTFRFSSAGACRAVLSCEGGKKNEHGFFPAVTARSMTEATFASYNARTYTCTAKMPRVAKEKAQSGTRRA